MINVAHDRVQWKTFVNKVIKNVVLWDVARVGLVLTDVSEERITSIFRVENPRARNQCEQVAAD
jgi:hypothetical protein